MYLMIYDDETGKRVYTLKVRSWATHTHVLEEALLCCTSRSSWPPNKVKVSALLLLWACQVGLYYVPL